MRQVSVLQAKTHLSSLLTEVEQQGGEIVITRHGRPVARLMAARPASGNREEAVERILAARERIAAEWNSNEPFDWKAAVEEGRG
ncbi:MAG: prevent-host-death family protein [Caulobacter sp.]|nr:prevent-host-death family protein [Caulobacter sp.]